jgi:transcriptional regulator with PAS, ATPase and Fis domain
MPSISQSAHDVERSTWRDHVEMVASSEAMRQTCAFLLKVAGTDCTVVITGETGTGKELVAEMVHRHSRRSHGALVSINTAALPDTLLESELFGYERGAFTGAFSTQPGKLEAANGGTIFLDEIGDMSLSSQAKLLRAVEKREIYRLGSMKRIPLDVRWVCATHRNLEKMVAEGLFRSDLYYRINVARIHLPPLRERKEDIPLLLERQLVELNRRTGSWVQGFSAEALECLLHHSWPGNVRELRNVVEMIFINGPGPWIEPADLPPMFRRKPQESASERDALLAALASTRWNKSQAAEKLCWSRMTLYRKMAKYRISTAGRDS